MTLFLVKAIAEMGDLGTSIAADFQAGDDSFVLRAIVIMCACVSVCQG